MKKILLIDFCNYQDYPIGGHLTFARQLMNGFGSQLSLIGITTSNDIPIGKWIKNKIDNREFDFFALARYDKGRTKHIIPDRIACLFLLRFYRKRILIKKFKNVFIQRPEIIIATKDFGYKNICYRFPGTENALKTSKYRMAGYFAGLFDKLFFNGLKHVALILASADEAAISGMISRSKGLIVRDRVIKFPTRIDTDIFHPVDKGYARERLGILSGKLIITTVGRLSWLKGWKLMLDSFKIFLTIYPESVFYFIGDGEDKNVIAEYTVNNNLEGKVKITGMKDPLEISLFLNASDLFVMGSFKEGWSTSLMEAIACSVPVCVTRFSSAEEMVFNTKNGYVVGNRDPNEFSDFMVKTLNMEYQQSDTSNFSISALKKDLIRYWELQ
jgi:glycosyltransferase involved in cell wall biosynthesis